MKVWGIGAYFPEKEGDITKECLKENAVVIGFKEEEKQKYYELFRSIEIGDFIFIKTRFMPTQDLKVKAIGVVVDNQIRTIPELYNAKGIKVRWIEDFSDTPRKIQKENEHDGDTRTIYQEMNENVIRQIMNLL